MEYRLVCLHGFTGGVDSFSALDLDGAILIELAGHGATPDLTAVTFDHELRRVAQLLSQIDEPLHLVGYSMGARVALGVMLRYPHLIQRATLIGVNPGLQIEAERQERLQWERSWIDLLNQGGLEAFEQKWSLLPLFQTQHSLTASAQHAQKEQRLRHTAQGLAHALQVLGLGRMPNFWPELLAVRCPTQLIVGELDEKFVEIAAKISRYSSSFTIHRLDGVGHNPLIEAPAAMKQLLLAST